MSKVKHSFLLISILFSYNTIANICFVQKFKEITYASLFIGQKVYCEDLYINKGMVPASFLIVPLPYHWGNSSREYLSTFMEEKGLQKYGEYPAPRLSKYEENPVSVFSNEDLGGSEFCVVFKKDYGSKRTFTGESQFLATVRCGDENRVAQNITHEELLSGLKAEGYSFVTESSANKYRYSKYENSFVLDSFLLFSK